MDLLRRSSMDLRITLAAGLLAFMSAVFPGAAMAQGQTAAVGAGAIWFSSRNIMRWVGLQPGPRFKEILEAIQTEQLEGRILDRTTALEWVGNFIESAVETETP